MEHKDFEIGEQFTASAGFRWLCTDKGARTITAIMLDYDKDPSWFVGPPYAVDEVVFDEHDMKSCYGDQTKLLEDRMDSLDISIHPGFLGEDVSKMFKSKYLKNEIKYPHKKVLRRDRVGQNGEIWHPYSASPIEQTEQEKKNRTRCEWTILIFEIFTRKWSSMHEDDFIQLPFSSEQAMRLRVAELEKTGQYKGRERG